MNNILTVLLVLNLVACSVSPGRQADADESRTIAKAESNKAAKHGDLPGTPDNLKGINEAYDRSKHHHKIANEKETSLLEQFIVDLILK